jgi:hypothetical protein
VQPDKLGDMPKAMWWAASMLAKIGGGDLVPPLTTLGRIIAAITVMLGIGCFALPVAIIGRGFYEEIRRRDFVVTFAMVARVPLFARLDAAAIVDLVAILRARTVPSGTTIIRKGERGNAMYMIASGRVEVESAIGKVVLEEGEFFGEMALLSREPRSATVTAVRATETFWCLTPTISCGSSIVFPTSAQRFAPSPRSAGQPPRPAQGATCWEATMVQANNTRTSFVWKAMDLLTSEPSNGRPSPELASMANTDADLRGCRGHWKGVSCVRRSNQPQQMARADRAVRQHRVFRP